MPSRNDLKRRRERLEAAIAYYEKHSRHEQTSASDFLIWAERELDAVRGELDAEHHPLAERPIPAIRSLN